MCQWVNYNLQHCFPRPVMFLYGNSVSISRSLCFSCPSITPSSSSSPSPPISFFFLCPFLHCTDPGCGKFSSPCSPPSLSLQPKGLTHMAPWAGMGGGLERGRAFQRPAVPLPSPFPPALVSVFFCYIGFIMTSKVNMLPAIPSYLATGSWGEPGLEQHPQTAHPLGQCLAWSTKGPL